MARSACKGTLLSFFCSFDFAALAVWQAGGGSRLAGRCNRIIKKQDWYFSPNSAEVIDQNLALAHTWFQFSLEFMFNSVLIYSCFFVKVWCLALKHFCHIGCHLEIPPPVLFCSSSFTEDLMAVEVGEGDFKPLSDLKFQNKLC